MLNSLERRAVLRMSYEMGTGISETVQRIDLLRNSLIYNVILIREAAKEVFR